MYRRSLPQRSSSAVPLPRGVPSGVRSDVHPDFHPREWAGQPLGLILTTYREAYGKSVEEVAQDLCIRRAHLRALESDDYQNLVEPSYAAGFVRTYAKYLGLPPEDMVSRFRETYGEQNHLRPLAKRGQALRPAGTVAYSPRWPSFAVLVIAALLLGASYMVMAAYTAATNPPPQSQLQIDQAQIAQNGMADVPSVSLTPSAEPLALAAASRESAAPVATPGSGTTNIALDRALPSTARTLETVAVAGDRDQVVVYGIPVPPARPNMTGLVPKSLERANQEYRVVIQATGLAHLALVDHATGQSFLRSEYQRGDQYQVPDGQIVRLISQDTERLRLIMDGKVYEVAPAIAALNEPLVLDPDSLPQTNQLILVDDAF